MISTGTELITLSQHGWKYSDDETLPMPVSVWMIPDSYQIMLALGCFSSCTALETHG